MSSFDVTLTVGSPSLGVPSEEQLKEGIPPIIEVQLPVGLTLPLAQAPNSPPLQITAGVVRFGLDRDTALDFFEKGLEEAQKLPAPSRLEVAQDLGAVESAAAQIQQMTERQ